MIDCGEGAQMQLRRSRLKFSRLNHIFISHLHGDHCFGLLGLISTFGLLGRTADLHIHSPRGLEELFAPMLAFFCKTLTYKVFFHEFETKEPMLIYDDRSVTVTTIPLKHRIPCCGFLFEEKQRPNHIIRDMVDFYKVPVYELNRIKNGADFVTPEGEVIPNLRLTRPSAPARKYAYCSDTIYRPSLAEQISNVDLLFHEATFAQTEQARAKETYHTTAAQAAQLALDANVKQLVIGHFSARYEDESILFDEASAIFPQTILAKEKEMEKFEQEKEQELYTTKIDFFTNVAHEIRTPLTLIKCPLENVLADRELSENVRMELEIMDQNVERLLNLINQLLDFRKAENKGFKLNPKEYNIGTIVHSVYKYFTTLAKQRGIKLEVEVPEEELLASVDKEALTKILSNLFANALKYARTYVYLHLSVDEKNEVFTISMSNDGNIVPIEMRENIFKAFVQYRDGKDIVSGTGIGLAMARYLAELHQGMLVMDRELDCNRFILSIPILHQTLPDDSEEQHKKPGYDDEDREVSDKDKREVASILVVEDNKDMLAFVFRQLSSLYHVLIAENGVEALDVLEQKSVDLIISDIMMPLMDGVELCKHLKQNLDYSHIPVILLTAKTNLESRIEGLEEGADAYIEKPFSMEYLRANVANLLSNRERLRRHFIEFPFIKADAMAQTKADEMFISKLNEYVLRHLDNTDLQIDDIADAMNMGRSNFYRKLKGILNMSPNEYLRLFRLKQAASILKEGTYGVVEVSYMVGFSTPSYFSSCFKKQFGVLPKDFISH